MFGEPLSTARLRRRFLVLFVAVMVLLGVTTVLSAVAGYDSTGSWSGPSSSNPSTYSPDATSTTPTPSEQRATLAATDDFRRQIVTATERFADETTALVASIRASRVAAAESDELAAQAAFDVFRPDVANGTDALAPLDALVSNQDPALPPSGLHAVERDLWTGHVAAALAPATALANDGLTVEVALFRSVVTPSTICADVQESLSWTVDDVIDAPQEQFSHDDLVDVHATVAAAASDLASVAPLGRLVDPADTRVVATRLASLVHTVDALAPTALDSSVAASTWRVIAEEIDAVLSPLGQLGGRLYGYGTGRAYA